MSTVYIAFLYVFFKFDIYIRRGLGSIPLTQIFCNLTIFIYQSKKLYFHSNVNANSFIYFMIALMLALVVSLYSEHQYRCRYYIELRGFSITQEDVCNSIPGKVKLSSPGGLFNQEEADKKPTSLPKRRHEAFHFVSRVI